MNINFKKILSKCRKQLTCDAGEVAHFFKALMLSKARKGALQIGQLLD